MATVKSYTDIEQSKKLAEILPLESADMYYPWYIEENGDTIGSGHRISIPSVGNLTTHKVNKRILSCWSLSALLEAMPNGCLIKNINGKYKVLSNSSCVINDVFNNSVDACVAMIEKLHKLKML